MIRVVFIKELPYLFCQTSCQCYTDFTLPFAEGNSSVKDSISGYLIKGAGELPRIQVNNLTTTFEMVKFFYNGNGDNYVVFLEMMDTGSIVKNDVGVKYKGF